MQVKAKEGREQPESSRECDVAKACSCSWTCRAGHEIESMVRRRMVWWWRMLLLLWWWLLSGCSLRSLSSWSLWNAHHHHTWHSFGARIHTTSNLASPIQWDHSLFFYTCLTYWTFLTDAVHLKPLVETWPAEQMSTKSHHWILCQLQANVAIKASPLLLLLLLLQQLLTVVACRCCILSHRAGCSSEVCCKFLQLSSSSSTWFFYKIHVTLCIQAGPFDNLLPFSPPSPPPPVLNSAALNPPVVLCCCCSDALSVSLYFFLPCINITSWRR